MTTAMEDHRNEYKAALFSTLIMIAAGNAIGWTSPTLPYLLSDESHLPISSDQGSWINSLMILSSVATAIPAAWFAEKYGRKIVLLSAAVPYAIGWVLILIAESVPVLYVARIFPGLGYGIIYTVAPMYLGEIASDKVRGSLSILITMMNKLGILIQYCIGPHVSMSTLAWINLTVPVVYFVLFMWQPESPYYYVNRKRYNDAKRVLRHLKCKDDIEEELNKIEATVTEQMVNKGTYKELFCVDSNRNALIITAVLFATQQFCGSAAVITYAQLIFSQAEGLIEASHASIVLGTVQFIMAFITVFLVDHLGRKPLLLFSAFGVFTTNIIIGTYFFAKDYMFVNVETIGLLPVIVIVAYIIFYTIGLSTVPMAVTSEIFPTNVKSHATSVLQIFVGLTTFIVTKLFQVIADAFGAYVIFWIFAAYSILGFFFILFRLPETKCKSFVSIQNHLKSHKGLMPIN